MLKYLPRQETQRLAQAPSVWGQAESAMIADTVMQQQHAGVYAHASATTTNTTHRRDWGNTTIWGATYEDDSAPVIDYGPSVGQLQGQLAELQKDLHAVQTANAKLYAAAEDFRIKANALEEQAEAQRSAAHARAREAELHELQAQLAEAQQAFAQALQEAERQAMDTDSMPAFTMRAPTPLSIASLTQTITLLLRGIADPVATAGAETLLATLFYASLELAPQLDILTALVRSADDGIDQRRFWAFKALLTANETTNAVYRALDDQARAGLLDAESTDNLEQRIEKYIRVAMQAAGGGGNKPPKDPGPTVTTSGSFEEGDSDREGDSEDSNGDIAALIAAIYDRSLERFNSVLHNRDREMLVDAIAARAARDGKLYSALSYLTGAAGFSEFAIDVGDRVIEGGGAPNSGEPPSNGAPPDGGVPTQGGSADSGLDSWGIDYLRDAIFKRDQAPAMLATSFAGHKDAPALLLRLAVQG